MKGLKLIFILTLALLSSSCEINDGGVPMESYIEDITIGTNQLPWRWSSEKLYFYCDVAIPALTLYVYESGVITTFYVAETNNREVIYPLPYDYFQMNDGGYRWTEQSTCEIRQGAIRFITQSNDFDSSTIPPILTFRVKLLW